MMSSSYRHNIKDARGYIKFYLKEVAIYFARKCSKNNKFQLKCNIFFPHLGSKLSFQFKTCGTGS